MENQLEFNDHRTQTLNYYIRDARDSFIHTTDNPSIKDKVSVINKNAFLFHVASTMLQGSDFREKNFPGNLYTETILKELKNGTFERFCFNAITGGNKKYDPNDNSWVPKVY